MAEVVGIVNRLVSLQALASQITDNIKKLRSNYDQIQDGPKRFKDLLKEAEDLQRFYEDYEQPLASAQIQDTTTVLRGLERCKTCVDQLIQLTDSLSLDIQANRTGRKGWSFKKDKEEEDMRRLEYTIKLLCLSCRMHPR